MGYHSDLYRIHSYSGHIDFIKKVSPIEDEKELYRKNFSSSYVVYTAPHNDHECIDNKPDSQWTISGTPT